MITSLEPPRTADYEELELRLEAGLYAQPADTAEEWIGKKYRADVVVNEIFERGTRSEFDGGVSGWIFDLYVVNQEPMDISLHDSLVVWGTVTGFRTVQPEGMNPRDAPVLEVDYWRPWNQP